jgi:hypothetical protein
VIELSYQWVNRNSSLWKGGYAVKAADSIRVLLRNRDHCKTTVWLFPAACKVQHGYIPIAAKNSRRLKYPVTGRVMKKAISIHPGSRKV